MDEQARQAELTRARQEAAKFRTQLREYQQAFGHLDDEARNWMLETIKMTNEELGQDAIETAGRRFGELTVNWLGEGFTQWAQSLTGESTIRQESIDMDEQQLGQMFQQMEQRLTSAFDRRIQALEGTFDDREKQSRYQMIIDQAKQLGYDPESWQGKALFQAAADETSGDINAAHEVLKSRGIAPFHDTEIQQEMTVEGGANTILGTPPPQSAPAPVETQTGALTPAPPTPVPPTGGQVGGTGVPETPHEPIVDFDVATDATLELLQGLATAD